MNVLVVEPMKAPYEKEIESGLESLQHEVDGYAFMVIVIPALRTIPSVRA